MNEIRNDEKSNDEKSNDEKPLVILPAAGYARRMGSPQSKEVLMNPYTEKPFIHYSLEQAKMIGAGVHLITRAEKRNLIEYVEEYCLHEKLSLNVQTIQFSEEWPDTVLQSKEFWNPYNIMLLPDTDWNPKEVVRDVYVNLKSQKNDVVYAVFKTKTTNWGFVKCEKNRQTSAVSSRTVFSGHSKLFIYEKPKVSLPDYLAWGIIGFQKEVGEVLFKAHLKSTVNHQVEELLVNAHFLELSAFNDRTRGEA